MHIYVHTDRHTHYVSSHLVDELRVVRDDDDAAVVLVDGFGHGA